MKGSLSGRPMHRLMNLLVIAVTLTLASTMGGAPLAAQQPSTGKLIPPSGPDVRPNHSPVRSVGPNEQGERGPVQVVNGSSSMSLTNSSEVSNVELVGQVGGGSYAVAVQGNYVYLGVGPRLVVMDMIDPAHPTPVGQSGLLPDTPRDIAIAGSYAYIATGSAGLRIIDITNPVAPFEIGALDTPDLAEGIAVAGSYVYLADSASGLRIINVMNPAAPIETGSRNTPGSAEDVAVVGAYAYVADVKGGLRIINIANPAIPQEVGSYDTSSDTLGIAVAGDYAYLADNEKGLRIVDVSNPSRPTEVGALSSGLGVKVVLREHYAFLIDHKSEVWCVAVSNVFAPVKRGAIDALWFESESLAVAESHLFVTGGSSGRALWVFDVTNPTKPTYISEYRAFLPAYQVAVANQRAYTVGADMNPRFQSVDVSNPNAPAKAGICCEDTMNMDVAGAGNFAFVAADYHGIRVIDATNPVSPVPVAEWPAGNFWTTTVIVRGRYAYYWGWSEMRVFDISTPSAPIQLSSLQDIHTDDLKVAMTDDYAYVVFNDGGFVVYSIANPRAPAIISYRYLPQPLGYVSQVAISGHYLFIAATDNGLRIVDVSNPSKAVEVASKTVEGGAWGVSVAGQYLYVGANEYGLRVMDISNPLAPAEVGCYDPPGFSARRILLSDGLIYVSRDDLGLYVLRFQSAPITSTISGRVTDAGGNGIPGVTVWAGFPRNTTTDANGNYTFTGLPTGTYTIRPEKDPYVFSPESRAVTVPPSATSVNFTGQVPIVHVKLLYVPLNWQNTQAAFDAEADLQSSIFFDQVPLSACPEKYRVEKLSVAAQNFTGFTCSGDAIGSIREFLRQQGIKAEDYTAVIGLAETSPCPPTGGQSNGTNTVWVTAEYDIVTAHELGHFWGLSDQYCSDRDGMSTDDRCNDGDIQGDGAQTGDVNWLDSSLPCDCPPDWPADSTGAQCCNFTTTCDKPGGCYFKGVFIAGYNQSYLRRCDSEDYGELGIVHVNYGACCLGNKAAGGGRSIMSFANVPGSRAFDTHDLAHLNTRHELNCDVVTASQTTAGGLPSYVRQLILDVNLLVHQNDSVQDNGVRVTWGRPTSDSVLQGLDGNYAIAVFDASGAQVWSQAFPLYFDYTGPVVLGEDYSDITHDSIDVAFRIPHACGMSELRLYHSDRMIFSKPLPTVCPIYLPLVFRNN